jgi:hypothetical protein
MVVHLKKHPIQLLNGMALRLVDVHLFFPAFAFILLEDLIFPLPEFFFLLALTSLLPEVSGPLLKTAEFSLALAFACSDE